MKKAIFILAIIGLVFSTSSCGNKKKNAEVGTHTHEDGTVHADGVHDNDAKPNQEAFKVEDKDAEHESGEGDGHDHDGEHKHDDGTVHTDHN